MKLQLPSLDVLLANLPHEWMSDDLEEIIDFLVPVTTFFLMKCLKQEVKVISTAILHIFSTAKKMRTQWGTCLWNTTGWPQFWKRITDFHSFSTRGTSCLVPRYLQISRKPWARPDGWSCYFPGEFIVISRKETETNFSSFYYLAFAIKVSLALANGSSQTLMKLNCQTDQLETTYKCWNAWTLLVNNLPPGIFHIDVSLFFTEIMWNPTFVCLNSSVLISEWYKVIRNSW